MKNKKLQPYITTLTYSATGEPTIVQLGIIFAVDKKEAIELHLKLFGFNDQRSFDYFKNGVDACKFKTALSKTTHIIHSIIAQQLLTTIQESIKLNIFSKFHMEFRLN